MKQYFDMKWLKNISIIKINRFFTSIRHGLLIVHIYELSIIQSVSHSIVGSPKNIGTYYQKCICCKGYWKSVTPFKNCSECKLSICNQCIRRNHNLLKCSMCNKVSCNRCNNQLYRTCSRCLHTHNKVTLYCYDCIKIINNPRNNYTCAGCGI